MPDSWLTSLYRCELGSVRHSIFNIPCSIFSVHDHSSSTSRRGPSTLHNINALRSKLAEFQQIVNDNGVEIIFIDEF